MELAPIATEFEPAVTVGLSEPVPFMSAAIPDELAAWIVLLLIVVDSDEIWLLMLVTPVDNDATLLLVELRPVDSELIPVEVDVDSDATLLLVVDSPVDSELTPVDKDAMLVDVEVDNVLIAWLV